MLDKEFLKTLTILYVEDDTSIKNSLGAILSKVFGDVIICSDGDEGLAQFKNYIKENKTIDAIVSDINMPRMNGIDMVKSIREIDSEVPVLFTTAHGESNYLMEAIKLKVAHYALKPIDINELLKQIGELCSIEHNKKLLIKKSAEITHYVSIMDDLASIVKIDTQGNIVHVNTLLQTISGYSKEELLKMNIADLFHQNSTLKNYNELIKTIGDEDSYKGKIKFVSKNGEPFYLNTTILAQYNDSTDSLINYILIGFDQTIDEMEKQQTMQRVRKNISEQRSRENKLQKNIESLEQKIKQLQRENFGDNETKMIVEKLQKEKAKTAKLFNQITHYEEQFRLMEKEKQRLQEENKHKKSDDAAIKNESHKEIQKLQSKIIELQSTITKLEKKLRDKTYV